ncbi:type II toxin-antitoxin system RelE/ParE family toxin [Nostoc flagelliforme]|nr:type II toxin-antitoxin system RelE/ParE family toxin [Nostoc flagelliforme]
MSERYSLRIAKTAEKDLLDLQAKFYKQVVSKILSLQGNSQPQDCKALKGYEGGYRVRVSASQTLLTRWFWGSTKAQISSKLLH